MTLEAIGQALQAPTLTRESFDLLVSLLLEQHWHATHLTLDPRGGLNFLTREGKQHTLFTENMWVLAVRAEAPRMEVVQDFLRKIMTRTDADPELSQVIALIRDSTYVEMSNKENILLLDHLAGDLWIVYARDLPETTMTLTEPQRQELGIPRDQLRACAVANLERLLAVECLGDGPSFMLSADGTYEASLLLLDNLWSHLAGTVEGDLIAAAPSRDVLLFTGANSREGISLIREQANAVVASRDHAISNTLLRRVDGAWKVY